MEPSLPKDLRTVDWLDFHCSPALEALNQIPFLSTMTNRRFDRLLVPRTGMGIMVSRISVPGKATGWEGICSNSRGSTFNSMRK